MQRWIHVGRIHNKTRPPVVVNYPNVDGSYLVIPPGETAEGSWVIVYDELEHPELHHVAPENELYFTDFPFEFQWAW